MSRTTVGLSWAAWLCACAAWLCAWAGGHSPCIAQEPNDTWLDSTVLLPGVRSVTDTLLIPEFVGGNGPDTTLGVFGQGKQLIDTNDDGSPEGNGLASALFGNAIGDDGLIFFAVSGFSDFDFDGLQDFSGGVPHPQTGDYSVVVNIRNSRGGDIGRLEYFGSLTPGGVDQYIESDPKWALGAYDAIVNNTPGIVEVERDDIDFWAFTDLPPNVPYAVEVTDASFDTVIGTFNDVGELLIVDDNGGDGLLSRIEDVVPASGVVYVAIVANQLLPEPTEYRLQLFVVPEPNTLLLFAFGAAAAASTGRYGSLVF